ncbi:GNAT family N-acetyltransferase [Microbulbifer spongiae]|uniref:GNAT family N-acetyltransferase n=1 Tax=Microbulbifer spongiae TaxID=2944933 RepID=A0ABY9ED55_9GAMM|nr:GNAT family N-acetyltransferase [Microbulbifer sp. MI-G]WKD49906.1 GNAT family N-acetyltransferase [Microbulbifer sp. MI-G]
MIRKAEFKELDRLEQLWLHAAVSSHPSLPRAFWLNRVRQFRRECRRAGLCLVFTGRHPAVAEAFITVLDQDRLAHLCVSPLFAGCGIGASLVAAAGQGKTQLQTRVLRENLRTRYFLQRYGFVETGRCYCAEYGQSLILMRCSTLRG